MKELQSLDEVFSKKLFRIPDYQRGYAWGERQLIDFWDDLASLTGERLHYTGVLSIKAVPKEKWAGWNDEKWLIELRGYTPYFVVDGQQRLTTVSIFLQCLVEAVEKLPENKDKDPKEIYLGSYSLSEIKEKFIVIAQPPANLVNAYKFGYETDNPSFEFMRYRIFKEPNEGTISETFYTLNLENAKTFFRENITKIMKSHGAGVLERLYNGLTQKFRFNVYDIGEDFDVFVAFETMNNRGKKLSDLELLKNRLIYLTTLYDDAEVGENEKIAVRARINEAWKEVYHQLGRNKDQPLNDDDFLRAHWIMYFKYSRKKGNDYIRFLLDEQFSPKKVLEKIEVSTEAMRAVLEVKEVEPDDEDEQDEDDTSPADQRPRLLIEEINNYVLSLKTAARHWYNTHHPAGNTDLTPEESTQLDRLNRIGIGYFRPLVMSAFLSDEVTETDRVKLFTALERFIFIVFRLSRAQANYRNSVYYNGARDLFMGKQTVEELIAMLEKDMIWAFDEQGAFRSNLFKETIDRKFLNGGAGFYGWNGLRYLLFEYEEELKRLRNQPRISWKNFITSEKDKVSIEHIYPQTPTDQSWVDAFKDHTEEQRNYLTGSLGNLLPLSSSINSSLQNDPFDEKKNTKEVSGTVVRNGYENGSYSEQEVAAQDVWTAKEIKERGLQLLKFVEKRWNLSLGNEEARLKLLHLDFLRTAESEPQQAIGSEIAQ